ncbi:MAG: hypothetical protein II983_00025 [Firmicutes bacterium]|nr:hypothetical protein [Bacillota bacterium]MBQ4504029.1 hypothetical protein [Bacillota bacterium]
MIQVILKALSFIFIMFLGYSLKKTHVLREEDHRVVSTIYINVALPCAIIMSFQNFTLDASLFFFLLLPFLSNLLMIFVAWFTGKKHGNETIAYQITNFPNYNIGSFTLPFLQSFMSPTAVVAACLYDTPNAFFTLGGSYTLACRFMPGSPKFTFLGFFKRIMSSVTIKVYTVLLILTFLNIRLPQFVFTLIQPAASANAFLSMFMLGLYLDFNFDKETIKKVALAISSRIAVGGLLSLLIWFFLPLPTELKQTCALCLLAPFGSMNPVYTEKLGSDYKTSALTNSMAIVTSMIIFSTLLTIWNA